MSLLARDRNQQVIQGITPINGQNIAVGAASALSTLFANDTTIIRLVSNVGLHYAVGPAATVVATAASAYLPAGVVEFIGVTKGMKVAVIQDVGAGVANITEGA